MRTSLSIVLAPVLVLALAGCGQTGPLYLPPTCSPLDGSGRIVETLDEHGNVLPPCPPPETVAAPAATPASDSNSRAQDETQQEIS